MTLTQMVDVWSTMTPKQRELVARLVWASPDILTHRSAMKALRRNLYMRFGSPVKADWDSFDWPFKFGGTQ